MLAFVGVCVGFVCFVGFVVLLLSCLLCVLMFGGLRDWLLRYVLSVCFVVCICLVGG